MNRIQRIIGKHALILIASGQKEIASQVFVYDRIREIRADVELLEVKVLMTYDEAFHRVFKVEIDKNMNKSQAKTLVLNFYNNLLNATMKLTEEEVENIKKQREAQALPLNKNKDELNE